MGEILLKNAAMLFKWWWRFSKEEEPLWNRIVGLCNNLELNKPIWKQTNKIGVGLWGSICDIWKSNVVVAEIAKIGIWVMVGNGNNTHF